MSLIVYTPKQLAEILDVDPSWVARRAATHAHHRFGRDIRFTEADALAFIEAHAVQPSGVAQVEVPAALAELKPGRASRSRRRAA